MKLEDARAIVAATGWLSRQPAAFQDQLLAEARLVGAPAGGTIYSLGDPPGGVFCVVDGFLDVLIAPGPLPPTLVHIARSGWWVGEAAAITGTVRRAALVARTDTHLIQIPERAVIRLCAEAPETWRRLAEITVSHLDNALFLAASLYLSDLRLRLAATILRLFGPDSPSRSAAELPITREEIGEIAGISRNTAGRLLADLARDGVIEMHYGRIVLTDPGRLRDLLAN